MNGKDTCRILKDIRRQIAEANDIELITSECTHKGNCRGTCPKCEAEVRYLERELEKRRSAQKRIALAGLAAGTMLALTGCAAVDEIADKIITRNTAEPAFIDDGLEGDIIEVVGEVEYNPEQVDE